MTTLPYVLAAMALLSPGRDHTALGGAIAARVDAEAPLFDNDATKRFTVSLLVAMAFRESSLRNEAEGDRDRAGKPRSFCAFQIHLPNGARTREGWDGDELVHDAAKCAFVAMRMVRASIDALDRAGFWVDAAMVGALVAIAFADRLLAKKWSCAPEEAGPTRHRR